MVWKAQFITIEQWIQIYEQAGDQYYSYFRNLSDIV